MDNHNHSASSSNLVINNENNISFIDTSGETSNAGLSYSLNNSKEYLDNPAEYTAQTESDNDMQIVKNITRLINSLSSTTAATTKGLSSHIHATSTNNNPSNPYYLLATDVNSLINESISASYSLVDEGGWGDGNVTGVLLPSDQGYLFPTTGVTAAAHSVNESAGFTYTEKVVIGCFLSIIIVCAIAGNLLVCVAIFTDRHLGKASNYFYVSLAVADLLVAGVVMTFAVANDIMGHWIFGSTFCNIWLSSDVMCSTASILNICAISLDRFLHIKDPYNYESRMTPKKTLLFITTLWVLSALISFLPIHLGWHETQNYNQYINGQFICLMDLNPTYAVTSSIISFYVPCVIMIAIYAKLYMYARRHVKNIKRNSTWSAISTAMLDNHNVAIHQQHQYRPSDQKAAITLGVIMGTFLFCWTPFFAINVTAAFCSTCVPPIVFNISTWLGYINSVANPIIYPVFNKEFRTAFKRILSCPGSQSRNSGIYSDYSDKEYRIQQHLKGASPVPIKDKEIDRQCDQSSNCCHFCCVKLHYTSVQLNGHSNHEQHSSVGNINVVTSPSRPNIDNSTQLSPCSPDIDVLSDDKRRHSQSPLINAHVVHSVSNDIDILKLDRVTVV